MTATNQAVDSQQWRLSFGHVIRSEYLKLVTLRSLRWTFAITLILLVGTNLLIASLVTLDGIETLRVIGFGVAGDLAMLTAFVLGVLYVTGEYSSGMVKLTFSGVPRRGTVVAAKVTVLGVVGLVVYAIAEFVSFFVSAAIVTARGVETSFNPFLLTTTTEDTPNEILFEVLVGQVVFLTFITLLGSFLAWIFRSTPLSIVIGFALLFALPAALLAIPGIPQVVIEYAPAALSQMAIGDLTLLEGSIAAVIYLAVFWTIAAAIVSRRDV